MSQSECSYGQGDCSYKMAGELQGITQLVDQFYQNMEAFPEAKTIRDMHPKDLTESRKKLTYFLSGWLGGPSLYAQHYRPIGIPAVHRHLDVGVEEMDAWLYCMKEAIACQSYEKAFGVYLIEQLRVPAERIRHVCTARERSGR